MESVGCNMSFTRRDRSVVPAVLRLWPQARPRQRLYYPVIIMLGADTRRVGMSRQSYDRARYTA